MYTRQDLVTFGNYLLSDLRKSRFDSDLLNNLPNERTNCVHDSDISNWEEMEKEVNQIFEEMKQEIRDKMLIDSVEATKPPIGLIPKEFDKEKFAIDRFIEVCGAISRYYEAGMEINPKWIEEYNDLVSIVTKPKS